MPFGQRARRAIALAFLLSSVVGCGPPAPDHTPPGEAEVLTVTETPDLDREMPYLGSPPTSAPPPQGTNRPPPTAHPKPASGQPSAGGPRADIVEDPRGVGLPNVGDVREVTETSIGRREAKALALSVIDLELEPTVVLAAPYEAGPLRQGIASFPEMGMIGEPLWDAGRFGSAGREQAPVWMVVLEHDPDVSVCYRAGIIANPTPRPEERWLLGVFIDATDGRTAGSSFVSRDAFRAMRALPTADITSQADSATQPEDGPLASQEHADRSRVGPEPSDRASRVAPPTAARVASPDADGGSEVLPFQVGSRWIYRLRMRDDRVWASGIATRTLSSLRPASTGDSFVATFETTSTLTRVPEVEIWAPMIHSRASATALDRNPVSLNLRFTADGLADLGPRTAPATMAGSNSAATEQPAEPFAISSGWRLLWTEDVETPSGTYRNCQLLQNRPGQTGGDHRWFCPEIGLVKEESCSSSNPSSHVLMELIELRPPRGR